MIEVGNIFKLGTKYSVPLGATYLDEHGQRAADRDGLLRDRPGPDRRRRRRAAPRRGRHRLAGWAIAPFHVHLVVIGADGDPQLGVADQIESELESAGLAVLVDDRDIGPGARFADAELIGAPARITVGKRTATDGTVDVQVRRGRDQSSVPVADVSQARCGGSPTEEDSMARSATKRELPSTRIRSR